MRVVGESKRRGRKPDLKRRDAMRALYRGGMTLAVIGERYGVTRERARQIIDLDITARPPKPAPPPAIPRDAAKHHERMIEMRRQGCFIRDVAKALDLHWITVQRHLSALGYGVGKGRRSRLR